MKSSHVTPEKPLMPEASAPSERDSLIHRWNELELDLVKLGRITPSPYCYVYDLIQPTDSGYAVQAEHSSSVYFLPRRISPNYSPVKQIEHRELIDALDRYFAIKSEISKIKATLKTNS